MNLPLPYWAVRKTRYGKLAFDVVEVVKATAKTHEIREQDHRGKWGRACRIMKAADYAAAFISYTDASQAAQRANRMWDAHLVEIERAQREVTRLINARRDAALAAIQRQEKGE